MEMLYLCTPNQRHHLRIRSLESPGLAMFWKILVLCQIKQDQSTRSFVPTSMETVLMKSSSLSWVLIHLLGIVRVYGVTNVSNNISIYRVWLHIWNTIVVDGVNGKFIGTKLSDESASMVVAGDFTNRGLVVRHFFLFCNLLPFVNTQDVSTISYFVPNYFESPNPAVNLYASSPITARKINEEVLFLIADPSNSQLIDEVEFLDVSGKKLSLVVLPPGTTFNVGDVEGVKVILGQRALNLLAHTTFLILNHKSMQ
jgi:hypothetical protein